MRAYFLLLLMPLPALALDNAALQTEAGPIIQTFATELKQNLTTAMQAGGPLAAVSFCQLQAGEITASAHKNGWRVSRVSEKNRNALNLADEYEQNILQGFAQRHAAGEAYDNMWSIAEHEGEIRVLKAIAVQEPCLACHGENISADVQQLLKDKYPADLATGYKTGELRGAFSLIKIAE
jgi:hypothetical protein